MSLLGKSKHSCQEINCCGQRTSAFSPNHDLTFSLEPPRLLCSTVSTAPTPLEAGTLTQYGGLGSLRHPGLVNGKPGGTSNLGFDHFLPRLSSAISVSSTEGGAEGVAAGRRRRFVEKGRPGPAVPPEVAGRGRPIYFGHLRIFKGRFR